MALLSYLARLIRAGSQRTERRLNKRDRRRYLPNPSCLITYSLFGLQRAFSRAVLASGRFADIIACLECLSNCQQPIWLYLMVWDAMSKQASGVVPAGTHGQCADLTLHGRQQHGCVSEELHRARVNCLVCLLRKAVKVLGHLKTVGKPNTKMLGAPENHSSEWYETKLLLLFAVAIMRTLATPACARDAGTTYCTVRRSLKVCHAVANLLPKCSSEKG